MAQFRNAEGRTPLWTRNGFIQERKETIFACESNKTNET